MMKICAAMVLTMAFLVLAGIPIAYASMLTVTSQGGGLFLLQGTGLENVAAMDITLQYDDGALGNPRFEQGGLISGAMMAVNSNVPGVVRIAVIRITPITGGGTIAFLTFDRIGIGSNTITGLTVKLTDINGRLLHAQTQVVKPQETVASTSQQPASQGTESKNAAAKAPPVTQVVTPVIAPGIVIKTPESGTSQQDKQPVTTGEAGQPAQEPSIAKAYDSARKGPETSTDPPIREKAVYTQKSVLDLFKDYSGPRTPKALLALFEQEPMIGCRQEPSLVLSDGIALAKVAFLAPAEQKSSPDVALIGASLVSLERDRENSNTWIATVRPHRNVIEAKIIMPLKDIAMVIPLTVAPKVNISLKTTGKVTEEDFNLYLKDSGRKRSQGRDLNGDGRTDYLDDYIFTANYLANLKTRGRAASLK